MPRNGSGTYSLPAGNPVVTGTVISSTVQNNTTSDIATALTNSIAKDGQTTPTANLPLGGFKLTGLGAGSAATDSANLGQIQSQAYSLLATVAGTDTITATTSPVTTAYAAGQTYKFVSAGANTGAATININSLGAKNIFSNGVALLAGAIPSSTMVEIVYDGTQFNLIGISGAGTLSGALNFAPTVTIASASTVNIGAAASNIIIISGTTTITAFDTIAAGVLRYVRFSGALTLTHNATSLILPTAANVVTVANDEAVFVSLGSGNWKCISYSRADGSMIAPVATQAEMESASNTTATVTPGRVNYHPGVAKGWVNFNGSGSISIRGSRNVTSITDTGTGLYGVNWDIDFSGQTYAAVAVAQNNTNGTAGGTAIASIGASGGLDVGTSNIAVSDASGTLMDVVQVCVVAYGDQA